jgi:hypothetical protein
MKNIKDIVIGIFAVIGFAAIVTGFTNEAEVSESMNGTYELHNSPDGKVILLDTSTGLANTVKEYPRAKYKWLKY